MSLFIKLQGKWNMELCIKSEQKVVPAVLLGCCWRLNLHPGGQSPPSPGSPGLTCTQSSSSLWTNQSYMNHTQAFSKLPTNSFIFLDTSETKQLKKSSHTLTHAIPEIACIICLVIISRSSSDRCARLSTRAETARGAGSCLPPKSSTFSLFARSCCSALVFAGEDAALDSSRATSSANTTRTLPDMSVDKKKKVILK